MKLIMMRGLPAIRKQTMTNKIKEVWEILDEIENQWDYDRTTVDKAITADRQAIHALLREMTTRKSVKELFPDADVMNSDERLSAQVAYKNAYNQALDDILTLIDELFSDKTGTHVSHK